MRKAKKRKPQKIERSTIIAIDPKDIIDFLRSRLRTQNNPIRVSQMAMSLGVNREQAERVCRKHHRVGFSESETDMMVWLEKKPQSLYGEL